MQGSGRKLTSAGPSPCPRCQGHCLVCILSQDRTVTSPISSLLQTSLSSEVDPSVGQCSLCEQALGPFPGRMLLESTRQRGASHASEATSPNTHWGTVGGGQRQATFRETPSLPPGLFPWSPWPADLSGQLCLSERSWRQACVKGPLVLLSHVAM